MPKARRGAPMKPLKDCEFTAFISYAHADDAAWFDWVTQFRNELERGLGALLRGVKLPRMHLSGENGPVAGVLSDQLKQRVESSFAMIIVVHDNYAQSDWCLRELEYFKSLFGDEGFRDRLYIVAMSESAMLSVSGGSAWKQLLPTADQVWLSFFEATDPNRPLDIYLSPGFVSPKFRMPFERLRGDFAAKLRAAASETAGAPARPVVVETPTLAPPVPGPVADGGGVVFGLTPDACTAAVALALAQVSERGLQAQRITMDASFGVFAEFKSAEHLVLAFDDTPALFTMLSPGGHLQVQQEAWIKQGRPAQNLHWLDLRPNPPPQPWQGAAAWVAEQGLTPVALPALLDQLRPMAKPVVAQTVRIYIESNRHERTLWEPLGEQIRVKWDEICGHLAPDRVPPLSLRARGLPVDEIDRYPNLDDADGVVLLWGRKTSDALVAQINKVENKLAPGRDAAPGIVAYLMPPQESTEPIPAWGWQVLRFDARDEQHIDVVEAERDELKRFLQKVFERRQQRDKGGST